MAKFVVVETVVCGDVKVIIVNLDHVVRLNNVVIASAPEVAGEFALAYADGTCGVYQVTDDGLIALWKAMGVIDDVFGGA